ncbi:MAG: YcxB family protein [Clostridia bacterium]|nr:YcxB family protein [Clostridia bacterium]
MEVRFENSYKMDARTVREFKYAMIRPLPWVLLSLVFALIFALLYIYARERIHLFCAVLIVILSALVLLVIELDARRTWKQMQEQSGGKDINCRIVFTDEKAENTSTGVEGRVQLNYADIKTVRKSRSLVILITKARLGHILRRDSFTVGNEPEFLEFIKERRGLASLPKGK